MNVARVTSIVAICALLVPSASMGIEAGADVSWRAQDEYAGAVYRSGGAESDVLDLMVENDLTLVRLRLWHTPAEHWHGFESTLDLAERAVTAGCDIMLDIHYSDTWADPAHQTKPAAWAGVSFEALVDSVYAYTNAAVRRFRDRGVPLAYVQVGNEISPGMLWDDGRVGGTWDTPQQWAQLCELLSVGAAAVRDSLPSAESPEIVIHVDNGANNGLCRWFYDNLAAGGVDYDVIGLSFYPWWHGTMAELDANMRDLSSRYGRPVMVGEAAYPWTLGWCDNTHNPIGLPEHLHDGYPATPDGQAMYLSDLLALVEAVPGGAGLVYWEPAHVCINGGPGSSWENLALFDFDGNALPSLAFARMHATSVATGEEQAATSLTLRAEPNPFSGSTTLTCILPDEGDTLSISIYDAAGRLVRDLVEAERHAGVTSAAWNGTDAMGRHVAAGVYFCVVEAAGHRDTARLVLVR